MCVGSKEAYQGNVYISQYDTAAVIKHNTLMNGITSTRGEAMGFIQVDTLTLYENGDFTLVKELKSTITNEMVTQPAHVRYAFQGSYARDGETVRLSAAVSGSGTVDWGTISMFLETGNGSYDSVTSPGILGLYPTAFFVENCKNVPMTVHLDEAAKTFSFEDFEPVILSAEDAGSIQVQTQALDEEAGLMTAPLVANPDAYCLKDTFSTWGLKVGTCINPGYLEEPYLSALTQQFGSVTLENHLKPSYTLSQTASRVQGRLSVEFSPETVQLLDWCKANGMPLRGHTLIWYLGTPEWAFHEGFESDAPNVGREELLRRMEDYISGFFAALEAGGWSEAMYCIDVVNEAVIAPDQMRKCLWYDIIGEDYVFHAYRLARKYAPKHIRLAYNDFDIETKTDKVIELVNSLKDKNGNSLVDVIGQQGHYGAYSSTETLMESLEKLGRETGCELQITELDVSISRKGTEDELKLQGRFYYNFVQDILTLRERGVNVTGITLWGFADALSWMPSGYLHIYDRNMVAKYAYFGMLGVKELAGFDGREQTQASGGKELRFVVAGEAERYVQLSADGSYEDTTTGAKIIGRYVFDGLNTYMLNPKVGGYANLTVSEDESAAERVEAAGSRMELVKA